jgi:hypothetical protein
LFKLNPDKKICQVALGLKDNLWANLDGEQAQ